MKISQAPEELGYVPGTTVMFQMEQGDTAELAEVIMKVLPAWVELFAAKNKKYAGLAGNELGAKGKFVDIFRKVRVLKSRLWDGAEVVGELNDELLFDIIGHAFLMVVDMAQEKDNGEEDPL